MAEGGAIYTNNTAIINNSIFSNNSLGSGSGGAIFYTSLHTMTINNTTFSNNMATDGGAIALDSTTMTINNSTFSDNSALAKGGAIYAFGLNNPFSMTVNSSTFSGNSGANGGSIFGQFDNLNSAATIKTSILTGGACSGTLTDGGNNIAFNAAGCPGTNSDPLVGTLSSNGGATQTLPLLEDSPAIDAYSTNCPAADQRGITRPQGTACDIGAYEWQPSVTHTVTNLNDSGAGSLRAAIASAVSGDTINFSVSGTITLTSGQLALAKSLTINGSGQNITISGNNASRVFYVNTGMTIALSNLTVTLGNVAVGINMGGFQAGGAGILNDGILTVTNVVISNNVSPTAFGGGIWNNATIIINDSSVSSNSAQSGGAFFSNFSTSTTINNSTFSTNSASNGGGGAIASVGSMSITNSTFYNNQANAAGAISNSGGGTVNISNSTFYENHVTVEAGAIFATGTMTITNSTFYSNQAQMGGAIFNQGAALNIVSSTFHDNEASLAPNNGASIYHQRGTTTVSSSIFAVALGSHCFVNEGSFVSSGSNIVNNTSCASYFTQPSDLNSTNPLLGALGNYGGTTQTIPLLTGSPAIDAYSTNCPATDQRGIIRPQGAACDIGAFELVPIVVTEATINENEIFAALEAARAGYPDISQIIVDFVPNAMNLTIATTGGVVGNVTLGLTQAQGFTTFNITSVTVNGSAAPASYLAIINRDLPAILTTALDALIIERFGSLVDVQTMTVGDSTLVISTVP